MRVPARAVNYSTGDLLGMRDFSENIAPHGRIRTTTVIEHRHLPGQTTLRFDPHGAEYSVYVRGLLERLA